MNILKKSGGKSGFTCKYSLIIYALVTIMLLELLSGTRKFGLSDNLQHAQTNQCYTLGEKGGGVEKIPA